MIYSDIFIENDDIALADGEAVLIENRKVVLQDLIHAIRESGKLYELIAERDPERRRLIRNQIIEIVEEDVRIIPGTVKFEGAEREWHISGDTYEFGKLRSPVWF